MCTSVNSVNDKRLRENEQGVDLCILSNTILIRFPLGSHIRNRRERRLHAVTGQKVAMQANDHIHCSEKVLWPTCDSCCYTTKPHNRSQCFTGHM